jgi:hypothetical protein
MDTGILSDRLVTAKVNVCFGSIDYSDPNIVRALCDPGLKEQTTIWGQIVTVLKMALMTLSWPVRFPVRMLIWVLIRVVSRLLLGLSWSRRMICKGWKWTKTTIEAYWSVYNKRTKTVVIAGFWFSLVLYGWWAVTLWACLIVLYIICTVPTDVRFYIELSHRIQSAWESTEDGDIEPNTNNEPLVVKTGRNRFACRLAARAISRVGLLSPTKANALVYQKVLLDEMRTINVRYADRVRILPLAVLACLERPDGVARVEGVISSLTSPNPFH